MRTENEMHDVVQRSAAFLDKCGIVRWWADGFIDLEKLAMWNIERCVLGQIYGTYVHGLDRLLEAWSAGPDATGGPLGWTRGVCGFSGDPRLGEFWKRLITARRNVRAQSLTFNGWLYSRDSLTMISPATGHTVDIADLEADPLGIHTPAPAAV